MGKKLSRILIFYKQYQENSMIFYHTSLILIISGLFFSRVILSIGYILFFANWFIEADFKNKWQTFKQNKAAMLISLIFILHIVGMLNTKNLGYGLSDLRIKLPLLLPIFYGSIIKFLNSVKKNQLLIFFLINALVAGIYGISRFEFFQNYNSVEDLFKISLTGQNIQLSLFENFAVCIILYFLFFQNSKLKLFQTILLSAGLLWTVLFIYLLNSLTGLIVLIVIILYSIMIYLKKFEKRLMFAGLALFGIFLLMTTIYIIGLIKEFEKTEPVNFGQLPVETEQGNPYQHDTISRRTENGHFIDINICVPELKKSWEKMSAIPFEAKDSKGHVLFETLIRYLSSKGLKKDSAGMAKMSPPDIGFVENGCANYLYTNKYSFKSRSYNIYWQIKTYSNTGNSTAQSISQRIEFLKAAKIIIKENFWFGVGSGDVMDDFKIVLKEMDSKLNEEFWNRVHNQYIVEFIALGIFGFLAFTFILFYPFFHYKLWNDYLSTTFFIIILLSFLTDNPLETQLGVSFFSFFYCLLVFSFIQKDKIAKTKKL